MADMAVAQLAEQRRQYEARIADLKEASELRQKEMLRTIKTLAEEVEFLRAKHFGPGTQPGNFDPRPIPVLPEEFDFMPTHNPHYLSEEEEEINALRAGGHLDHGEYSAALAQLRAHMGVPITIEE